MLDIPLICYQELLFLFDILPHLKIGVFLQDVYKKFSPPKRRRIFKGLKSSERPNGTAVNPIEVNDSTITPTESPRIGRRII